MATRTRPIEDSNISRAWAAMLLAVLAAKKHEAKRVLVTLADFDGTPDEDPTLRQLLDRCLAEVTPKSLASVQTVANTIFPEGMWKLAGGDREKFYKTYLRDLPSYTSMDRANVRGLYFGRLIAFDMDQRTGKRLPYLTEKLDVPSNQLEFIIKSCRPGMRRSALQAAIFDPNRDHVRSARLGFPCLQHIQFVPDFDAGTLSLNAFYATQLVIEKAYGNLLGLARLGSFVAEATKLSFSEMSVLIGVEKLSGSKGKFAGMDALEMAANRLVLRGTAATTCAGAGS